MKRAIRAAFALAAVTLAGCVTPEELAARDDATCQSYGAAPGSSSYTDCRIRVAEQRQQAVQAYLAQINENNRRQQEANAQALRDAQAAIVANKPPPTTTTTCTRTSSITVSCNSF
jgi:hypothetical protein